LQFFQEDPEEVKWEMGFPFVVVALFLFCFVFCLFVSLLVLGFFVVVVACFVLFFVFFFALGLEALVLSFRQ